VSLSGRQPELLKGRERTISSPSSRIVLTFHSGSKRGLDHEDVIDPLLSSVGSISSRRFPNGSSKKHRRSPPTTVSGRGI